jgi:heat shock protein HtpX
VLVAATVAAAVAGFLGRAVRGVSKGGGVVIFGALALVAVLVAAVLRVLALPAAMLLRAALSRRREELADASAVQFTRDPGGLRRALEKVAADTSPAQQIRPLARALCIEQPRAGGVGWLDRWMASHPPISARISWLRSLEGPSAA